MERREVGFVAPGEVGGQPEADAGPFGPVEVDQYVFERHLFPPARPPAAVWGGLSTGGHGADHRAGPH
ncbi:hypothetical protein GCM10009416_02570 [Craurococcus roseus]|uniref:Uncharacterized protein n=1 Tax=Craurococcus roseus TaxID=77585 RepID=A0ABP3PMZ8_9PROT